MSLIQSLGPSLTTILAFFGVLALSAVIAAVAVLEDY